MSKNRKESVNSVALLPENENLLLVGTEAVLSLWDLENKAKLKIFEGVHRGSIVSTVFVKSSFFLSAGASEEDHSVALWNFENESEYFTFSAEERVQNVFAQAHKEGEGISIGIVTKSGRILYFEHVPGVSRKKSKKPVGTIQIASDSKNTDSIPSSANSKVVVKIPILIGRFSAVKDSEDDSMLSIDFVYGSHLKPTFENINCDKVEKVTCLPRTIQKANHMEEKNGKSNLVVRISS